MAVQSLAEFLDELKTVAVPSGGLRAFRGSRNHDWDLLPGILRPKHASLLKQERDAVREMLSVRPGDFQTDNSMFDRLVRMQHFELPTRLLDVTANPLVALYFATQQLTHAWKPLLTAQLMSPLCREKGRSISTAIL